MPTDMQPASLEHAQTLLQQGNLEAAEQAFLRAIAEHPGAARAHFGLGKVLAQRNQPIEAEQAYLQAITLAPDFFEALANLGSLYLFRQQLNDALAYYARAEKIQPENPEIQANLCYLHKELGDFDSARACGLRALEINPDHLGALLNLGMVENAAQRYAAALPHLQHADELNPGHPLVMHNLGASYAGLGDQENARSCFLAALGKNPHSVETLYGLGVANKYLQRYEEAASNFKAVLELAPDHLAARAALAYMQLCLGEFREGWANHLSRARSTQSRSVAPSLPGHSDAKVLLLAEQGIGDELLFLRFAPELKSRGMRLHYRGSLRLKPLLADQDLIEAWLDPQAEVDQSAYDSVISVGNLPMVLGMDSTSGIPPALKLSVSSEQRARMAARLAKCAVPFIGVTWRAGTLDAERSLYKEIPLQLLGETLKDVPGSLIILQRHPNPGEIEQFAQSAGREVHDFSDANQDLEAMLALLSLIHDYVGVSNTNMHLLAGIGRTARVIVPHPTEWRWMEYVNESPWFPGFRIYRQDRVSGWGDALSQLECDLQANFLNS